MIVKRARLLPQVMDGADGYSVEIDDGVSLVWSASDCDVPPRVEVLASDGATGSIRWIDNTNAVLDVKSTVAGHVIFATYYWHFIFATERWDVYKKVLH